jgi:hypothetical protein
VRDVLGRGGYNITIYDLGVDLYIKTSFNCILSILYTWAILVLSKKHDFSAKYYLFSYPYDRLCILREFDEFAPYNPRN